MAQFRWTACILSCWALVAVPALCISGWLPHLCAFAEIETHQHDHQEDGDGCGHEAECSAGPCQMVVNRWDEDGSFLPEAFAIIVSPLPSSCTTLVDVTGDPPIWASSLALLRACPGEVLRSTILLI